MYRTLVLAVALVLSVSAANAADFLVKKQSPHSVSETLDRLTKIMQGKGITIFARVDHQAGARSVDLQLKPSQLLIFGNPRMGTPLMQADAEIGIALPLKALAWEDKDGKVWIAYTKPDVLKSRYNISGKDKVFQQMTGALDNLTNAAIKAK